MPSFRSPLSGLCLGASLWLLVSCGPPQESREGKESGGEFFILESTYGERMAQRREWLEGLLEENDRRTERARQELQAIERDAYVMQQELDDQRRSLDQSELRKRVGEITALLGDLSARNQALLREFEEVDRAINLQRLRP
ncbi:MAG: hypothetical protein AAF555_01990 [Verrucomicrobiota bacterium]